MTRIKNQQNALNLSGTFFEEHVQKISITIWISSEHFTLMLFIDHYFTLMKENNDKLQIFHHLKKILCCTIWHSLLKGIILLHKCNFVF